MSQRRPGGPAGGGDPVETRELYAIAFGLAEPGAAASENPRELRFNGRRLTDREAARCAQMLAFISRAFVAALPEDRRVEVRDQLLQAYVEVEVDEMDRRLCEGGA